MKGLLCYILAVYGWSWLITKSKLIEPIRIKIFALLTEELKKTNATIGISLKVSFLQKLNYLTNCIVCTSGWLAIPIVYMSQHSVLFKDSPIYTDSFMNLIILIGIALSSTWIIAYITEDAK